MSQKWLLTLVGLFAWIGVSAQEQEIKISGGPYLQQMGEHEVTIVWMTNRPAVSWVEIAPNDGRSFYATEHPKFYQTEMGRKVVDTLHRIHITGLEKGTKYRYRIYSREVTVLENYFVQYGHTVASESYVREPLSFTRFDYSKPEI